MRIFMSYRRQDSEWVSLSLYKSLQEQFPNDTIFKDIHTIKAGENFAHAITNNLEKCDVLLVVIGPDWLNCKDENGANRLFLPDDYVALEIATAIQKGKKIIPVLISSTVMPETEELPEILKELPKYQAVRIANSNFDLDVFNLANAINQSVGRKNSYADIINDIATGKVSQAELVQPQTHSAYALFSIGIALLILVLNTDFAPIIIITLGMIAFGCYAYYKSTRVKPLWLSKQFNDARVAAKSVRKISLISTISGIALIVLVIVVQGLQFLSNGGMDQVNKFMEENKNQANALQKFDSVSTPSQKNQSSESYNNTTTSNQTVDQTTPSNQTVHYTHMVTDNAYIYSEPSAYSQTENYLFATSTVRVLENDGDFTRVETLLPDGKIYNFWIESVYLTPLE